MSKIAGGQRREQGEALGRAAPPRRRARIDENAAAHRALRRMVAEHKPVADGGGNGYQTLVTLQHVTLTAADTQNYVV